MSQWAINPPFGKYKDWPKNEDGTPIRPVFLQIVTGPQSEVELTVNLLQAYSIPVFCQYPNNGEFGKVILGVAGTGTELYVPETMLDDARNILCADIAEEEMMPQEEE